MATNPTNAPTPFPGGMDPVLRSQLRTIRGIANELSDAAFDALDVLDDGTLSEVEDLLGRPDVLTHLSEGEPALYGFLREAAREVRLNRPARPAAVSA